MEGCKRSSGNRENLCPGFESCRHPSSIDHRAPSRYNPNINIPSSSFTGPCRHTMDIYKWKSMDTHSRAEISVKCIVYRTGPVLHEISCDSRNEGANELAFLGVCCSYNMIWQKFRGENEHLVVRVWPSRYQSLISPLCGREEQHSTYRSNSFQRFVYQINTLIWWGCQWQSLIPQ